MSIYIEAGRANRLYIKDLWEYRELFWILAQRDISVRFKQTALGVIWAVIKPLMSLVVFTVVFGKIAKLPSDGVPYSLMVIAGMLPWQFFSAVMGASSGSLLGNAGLISKVYFPRIIIPCSTVVVALVDFLISTAIAVFLFFWHKYLPHWQIVFIPLFMLNLAVLGLGVGCIFASLNVKYRDFCHIIGFVIQAWMYISPVAFASSAIPEKWRTVYMLNPVAGCIDGIRWCLYGSPVSWHAVVFAAVSAMVLVVTGFFMFRKMETEFADFI